MKTALIVIAVLAAVGYGISLLLCKFLRDSERKIDNESSEPKY